jgi:serine/threonine protein kinase
MEIYEKGEIWDGDIDNLSYSYTKVILRKGDAFFYARTNTRLTSPVNIEELDAIPIPIQDIWPPYSEDMTRAPTPIPVNCYVKNPSLLDCGSDVEPPTSTLVLAEARICENLKNYPHPNIAQYIGCITQGDRITGLCFEKYDMTLADCLLDRRYSVGRDVYHGIKCGIQHLHRLGLTHNDINPNNIMFKSDGTPVLIDFDSCAYVGEKLVKGGGWEDQIYEYASPANDYAALKKIEEIIGIEMNEGVKRNVNDRKIEGSITSNEMTKR